MILFSKENLFYNVHVGRFKTPSLIIDERMINIFDQKVAFFNPGKLYGNISIADLKDNNYTSELRNRLLAEAFYLTKDIEKYGTGFLRIREEIKDYPTMKFNYQEQGNGFATELTYTKQKISSVVLNEGLNEGLNSLLAVINKKPGIQAKDLPAF